MKTCSGKSGGADMHDLAFLGGKLFQNGSFEETNLYVEGERISEITPEVREAKHVVDCKDLMILPGLIDPHVHMELDLGTTKAVMIFIREVWLLYEAV